MRSSSLLLAAALIVVMSRGAAPPPVTAASTRDTLTARPRRIDFGERRVGETVYKHTRIKVTGSQPVRVHVAAQPLPDTFEHNVAGTTCPSAVDNVVMEPGDSCIVVVRWRPNESFLDWDAVGRLLVEAIDPETGALVQELFVPVTGTAVAR